MEYVLVSQGARLVERFARALDKGWHYREFHAVDAELHLATIDCVLRLVDIYDKVPGLNAEAREAPGRGSA